MTDRHWNRILFGLLIGVLLSILVACAVNPVTGKQELSLVGESQEIAIGEENYSPQRQAQGGDYVADPKLVEYVRQVGNRLAKVADRPLEYEFNIINDATPNAWALPGGKIAVNRGLLLELQSEAELAAVLGHEIVHAAARHSAQSMERGILLQGTVLALGVALSDSDYRGVGLLAAGVGAQLTSQHYSRDAESEADYFGIQYMVRAGYDPQAAVQLQQTFVRLNEGRTPGWIDGLFASHPPSQQRVEANRRQVAAFGNPGGEMGTRAYQQAIAHLQKTKPAYDAYAKAQKAYADGDLEQAKSLLAKARKIEPREAQFDVLLGKVEQRQGQASAAQSSFNSAVQKNPDYFAPYLERGLLQQQQGELLAARRDLSISQQKLPTAPGAFGLGLVAKATGDTRSAKRYFQEAAAVEGEIGKLARRELSRLSSPP